MPASLQNILDDILRKINSLEEDRKNLRQRCESLEQRNSELQRQISSLEKECDHARNDARFLTMSHRLADSPDSIVEARRFISSLIRRVDRAIALATDDPSF